MTPKKSGGTNQSEKGSVLGLFNFKVFELVGCPNNEHEAKGTLGVAKPLKSF